MLLPKKLWALPLLCVGFSGYADTQVQESNQAQQNSGELPFSVSRKCFARIFADYDKWQATMLERGVSLADFSNRFPRTEYEEYRENLECHFFNYPVDGLSVEGFLIQPKEPGDGELPVLILNRGGNGSSGRVNTGPLFHSGFPLANQGFIVIGSQYRGSRRRQQQNEMDGSDEFGGRDVEDVMALFDIIDAIPGADSTRIGMLGWSRGGFMTFIAATRTDRLSAIAVGGTPSDLLAELEHRPDMERVYRARIPDYDENKVAALKLRSPIYLVDDIDPELPVLILHGQFDQRVSLGNALNLTARLNDRGQQVRLVVYDNDGHGLWRHRSQFQNEIAMWFKSKLGSEARD